MNRQRLLSAAGAIALAVSTAGLLPGAGTAQASFPAGNNGLIAFVVHGVDGRYAGDIFVVSPDGTGKRNLTSSGADDETPSWSPDGQWIVWAREGQLWKMHADGSHKTQLTTDSMAMNSDPSFAPSGNRIVFLHNFDLHVMDADGGHRSSVGVRGLAPQWSPNGHWITYRHEFVQQSRNDLMRVHPDGSGVFNITANSSDAWHEDPDWSPDGSMIAFTTVFTTNALVGGVIYSTNIGWITPDGSRVSARGNKNNRYRVQPAWAPSGSGKLVFVQSAGYNTAPSSLRTVRYNHNDDAGTTILSSKHLIADPAWQPVP